MVGSENRREGFRMDDLLKLQVRKLDPTDSEDILADFDAYRLRTCLSSHLRNQTENRVPKLQNIRARDSEVADYLEHLEAQIVQLAARVSMDNDMAMGDTQEEIAVNMSATGLRFCSALEDLKQGQILELRMLLSTSGTELVALAEILRLDAVSDVTPEGKAMMQVSTHFTQIHPDDTEAIIRHMAKLQLLQLQARRND